MKTYDELVSLFEEANLAFLQAEHSLEPRSLNGHCVVR